MPEGFYHVLVFSRFPEPHTRKAASQNRSNRVESRMNPGDRGGRSTDLLPPGWLVASIDVNQGRLTLQRGARRVSLDL